MTTAEKPGLLRAAFSMKGGIGNVATFMGRRPPEEVKQALEVLPEIQKPVFRKVLQFVVEYVKGTQITEELWTKLLETSELSSAQLQLLFSGLLTILKTAVRLNLDVTNFKVDLQNLQIGGEYIADLATAFQKTITEVVVANPAKHVAFPCLGSFDWRVDVTISTSEMARVLKPTILIRVVDSEGEIHTFEANPEQFHKLRYSVARVLKEFDTLEKLPILKIDKNA